MNGIKLPPVLGLVDSGADTSMFPLALAMALGVDMGSCTPTSVMTASGVAQQFIGPSPIRAEVAGTAVHLTPIFADGLPVILLGREDFFSAFKVVVDQRKQRLSLHRY